MSRRSRRGRWAGHDASPAGCRSPVATAGAPSPAGRARSSCGRPSPVRRPACSSPASSGSSSPKSSGASWACRPGSSRCCQVSACWSRSPHAGSSAGASVPGDGRRVPAGVPRRPATPLGLRAFVARTLAGLATLGSGGPMGLEGPSLYAGAVVGSNLQRRLPRMFRNADRRVLLVAGAAAGVAAIFKAPATGAVFALEVPYQDDLARNMLLPAMVSSAAGYLVFVGINGTSAAVPDPGDGRPDHARPPRRRPPRRRRRAGRPWLRVAAPPRQVALAPAPSPC